MDIEKLPDDPDKLKPEPMMVRAAGAEYDRSFYRYDRYACPILVTGGWTTKLFSAVLN